MEKPKYISRGGVQVYQQPFLGQRVRYYGFVLEADTAAIQKNYCDQYLNNPSGGSVQFRAAMPYVVLAFTHIDCLHSQAQPYHDYGFFQEQETTIWVLTEDMQRNRLYWGIPYIFVSNPLAIAMGREVYGFPKEYGWFDIPTDPAEASSLSLDTLAIKTFDTNSEGIRSRLINVNRANPNAPDGDIPRQVWTSMPEAAEAVWKLLEHQGNIRTDLRLIFNTTSDLFHGRIPMVFLKQFRDVEDGAYACYQSIVESEVTVPKFYGGQFLPDDYEVDILPYDSHPIRHDLGLKSGPLKPVLSFSTYFDLEIGAGKEIWRA